jgi:Flp pilus assembly protein TadG
MLPVQPAVADTRSSSRSSRGRRRSRLANERGQALIEAAVTLPIILLIAVGIFEFGRAYQTYQVVTNAAREGARVAIIHNATTAEVESRVRGYIRSGQLANVDQTQITVNQAASVVIGANTASASVVSVSYPFSFMVINPVANLVTRGSTLGAAPFFMSASAEMRNEAQ